MWVLIWMLMVAPDSGVTVNSFQEVSQGVQEVYDLVLAEDGRVDYDTLKSRVDLQQKLSDYALFIAELDPGSILDKEMKIAVYANAYNVLTLIGVTRAYPVSSVRDIRMLFGFFTKDEWSIGGILYSLNDIEKKILRPLDPRIHFIINCASGSCPVLRKNVLDAANVGSEMEQAVHDFLLDASKNSFPGEGVWRLSKIFDWYKDDWGGKNQMIAFILEYRTDLKRPVKIKYLDYDWSLNAKQAN